MDFERGFSTDDLARMVRRRWPLAAAVGGGVTLVAIFIASILSNEYMSYATLLVEPQSINERLIESGLPERDINSRLHLMEMQILSRSRLSRVIDDLGLYEEHAESRTREEVIELMRGQIDLSPVLSDLEEGTIRRREVEINTFQLSFRHASSETAAEVANRLANDFIDQHIRERVELSGGTSEFIGSKLTQLSGQIAEVEARIAEVKAANSGSLPEDLGSNQRLHERVTDRLREAQRELAIARSDEAFYRQQMATGASDYHRYRNDISPERRLDTLQVQLSQLMARGFTEKHPDIIATRQEIADLEAQTQATEEDGGARLSLAQENARAEAQRAGLRVASGQEDIDRLAQQLEEVEQRLAATPRVAEQLGALQRQHDHLSINFQEFSDKQLEANVAADMERRQKGEQFRVLEAAYPSPAPAYPNRIVIVIAGMILGGVLGVGVAFLAEIADSSYHAPRALQDDLGIPVLASIPSVVLASDTALARRRMVRNAAAAALVTLTVLTASFVGNRWVNHSSDEAAQAPPEAVETAQ